MKKRVSFLALLLAVIIFSCKQEPKKPNYPQLNAPVAQVKPHEVVSKHGDKRMDNYFWLRNREDSVVIDYLKQENRYLDTMMAHTKGVQETLFQEMKGRIKEKDESVPYKLDDYFYYSRFEEGGEYPIFCRKKGSIQGQEEVLANGNELGKGHGYFNLDVSPSPNHAIAVLAVDTVGRRLADLK
jgi:oligopeptidase B